MADNVYQHEIERIRREYARRSREIPEDYYSLELPGNRFIYETRLREGVKVSEIKSLFPGMVFRLEKTTLAFPLACFIAPYSWKVCRPLDLFDCLKTHYLGIFCNIL